MKHNGKSLLSLALVLALGMLPGPALQARAADEDEVYTVSADAERVESEADAEPETPTLSEMIEQKQAEKTAASSDTEDAERNETAEPQGATPLRLLGATSGTLPTNQSSIVLDNDFIHNGDWTPTVNVTLDLNGHTLTIVDTSSQGGNGRICLDHRNISSVSHITVTDSVGGGNLVVGNFVQIDSGGATGQAIFELAGGTLTCQRAIDRGGNFSVFGVYYNAYGRAILNGGTITGCSGYGAATYGEGLYIGGEVNITGNSGGTDGNGNVFVYTGRTINITGDLGSSRIGVTTQTAPTADRRRAGRADERFERSRRRVELLQRQRRLCRDAERRRRGDPCRQACRQCDRRRNDDGVHRFRRRGKRVVWSSDRFDASIAG